MGGPNRDNISPETDWHAPGLKRSLWTAPLGIGFGSPSIRDGKVYILDRIGETQDHRNFDLETGKELWNYTYDAQAVSVNGSRTAPTVTGPGVFRGLLGHFMCIDLNTHQPVWVKYRADFGQDVPGWGVAQTLLQRPRDRSPSADALAAYKDTGDIVWKTVNSAASAIPRP